MASLHSLQRIINRLRLFAHALAPVRSLVLQLCDARVLAVFQTLGVYGREDRGLLLGRKRCDLEVLDARDRDDVIVAGVAGSGGAGVDCYEVEDGACGEEGAFVGLRVGSGGGELDAERVRVSWCFALLCLLAPLSARGRTSQPTYRAPMALPSASTVSTGAGVLAFGVATFVVLVVLAMLAEDKTVKPSEQQSLSIDPTLLFNRLCPDKLL
jgi:hypothetical protein